MNDLPPIQSFEDFEREVAPIVAPPWKSRFGAVSWADIDAPGPQHEWLVKGLVTRNEIFMLAGPSQSGKSFLAIDLAMSIARGIPFFDRKVIRGGVIYQAGESARGVRRKRLPAYREHYGLLPSDDVPFVMLSRQIDLYASDDQTNELIEECRHWAATFPVPLELVVIDTFAAATPGADENSAKDITPVLARCERIRAALGCTVALVHHMNAAGEKPRGHTSIFANLDSVLICKKTENLTDADNRTIREVTLAKAKDGESEIKPLRFVLGAVEIGRDEDGDPVTSCVVLKPNSGRDEDVADTEVGIKLSAQCEVFLQSIYDAVSAHGEAPPAELKLPGHVRVVEWRHVRAAFEGRTFEGEGDDEAKRADTIKRALSRHGGHLMKWRVIGRGQGEDKRSWIWMTGRKVRGFHPAPGALSSGSQRESEPPPPDEIDDPSLPI
mgnify:CR=1 FL=1